MKGVQLTDELLVRHLLGLLGSNDDCVQFLVDGRFGDNHLDLINSWGMTLNNKCLSGLPQHQTRQLWVDLVTDAVNVMKWHDPRETPGEDVAKGYKEWRQRTFGHAAYGIDDLAKYLMEFVEFERLLYGAERYYREHFLHVIRVWLIGVYILTKGAYLDIRGLDFEIPGAAEGAPEFELAVDERLAMWTIVALCHDLGYPLQKISSINAPIRQMLSAVGKAQVNDFAYSFPRQHQFIDNFIIQFISSKLVRHDCAGAMRFKTEIQSKYYLKFSKSFEDLQHGILSCTLLMKRLVYFLESDFDISPSKTLDIEDARQFHIRREILRAIAAHTCDEIYHILSNTLRFLLVISDELQQWDRPRFHEMMSDSRQDVKVELVSCNGKEVNARILVPVGGSVPVEQFIDGVEDQTRNLFRRFHKIFRSAVDANLRPFEFKWSLSLQEKGRKDLTLTYTHIPGDESAREASSLQIGGDEQNDWLYSEDKKLRSLRVAFLESVSK